MKNPSYLAVHIADISPAIAKPRLTRWDGLLFAMLIAFAVALWSRL